MKKYIKRTLRRLARREARYWVFFTLTGVIVSYIVGHFGIENSRFLNHFVNSLLRALW